MCHSAISQYHVYVAYCKNYIAENNMFQKWFCTYVKKKKKTKKTKYIPSTDDEWFYIKWVTARRYTVSVHGIRSRSIRLYHIRSVILPPAIPVMRSPCHLYEAVNIRFVRSWTQLKIIRVAVAINPLRRSIYLYSSKNTDDGDQLRGTEKIKIN